jgi:hypothetical protein
MVCLWVLHILGNGDGEEVTVLCTHLLLESPGSLAVGAQGYSILLPSTWLAQLLPF